MYESNLVYDRQRFDSPMRCLVFSVVQIGETYSNERTTVPDHKQRFEEISFIASGKGVMYRDGVASPVGKGDCFLSFRGEVHRIESNPQSPPHFCFLAFTSEDPTVCALIEELKKAPRKIFLPEAEQFFSECIRESFEGKPFADEAIGAAIWRLLVLLARTQKNASAAQPDSSLIYRITVFLRNHIEDPNAIGKLAGFFHLNERTLAAAFRRSMGESLHSYYQRMRMEHARTLLQSGHTVTEVAFVLGYSSIHPFSRAYKNAFGVAASKK